MKKKSILCMAATLLTASLFGQQEYSIAVPETFRPITSGHLNLGGSNPSGEEISFNSFYMNVDAQPFIPVMGEIHYVRVPHVYWEEQILKMKAGGINVVATYVFWNIHETEEGRFDWAGDKDLRAFLSLCKKHGMYTLVRVGPFCHGEIRNGGLPDWLYGQPFEVRSNDTGYLTYVKRLYHEIGQQLQGLYYKDGGTIIGIQLENELQHSASPWSFMYPGQKKEMTVANYDAEITRIGVSVQDRKTAYAELGTQHLDTLKKIAIHEGMVVPLYTVTGWGYAAVLEHEAIPVTAAYPYPFWAKPFMSQFFLFKDIQKVPDYAPVRYDGTQYPSFCAEMGVGIQITYDRRPRVLGAAAEALMLRTLGSGANGIGYYMYHGGLTPIHGEGYFFSDEVMGVPKISYDFQAPLGEYGKARDSYFNLRLIHLFTHNFGTQLAPKGVVLPERNEKITPQDRETLRYSVRSDGQSGFVFMTNFQDHDERPDQQVGALSLVLSQETIRFPAFVLKKEASAIFPFNMYMGSSLLKYATAQPLAIAETQGKKHYFFYAHEGMLPEYVFEKSSVRKLSAKHTSKDGTIRVTPSAGLHSTFRITDRHDEEILVTTLTRSQALGFNQWGKNYCITDATLMQDKTGITLQQTRSNQFVFVLPSGMKPTGYAGLLKAEKQGLFTTYTVEVPQVQPAYELNEISPQRYTFRMNEKEFAENLSDIILDIEYVGDTGAAFIEGKMVNDHLYYGNSWQIGLKQYSAAVSEKGMSFYFKPMPKDASYLIDFEKEKIPHFEGSGICKVNRIQLIPEYQLRFELR